MTKKIKISRKTKSSAYRFIKSLMNDGVEGPDIHNLVVAISDNVNKQVGGEILTDLIKNSKDENGDVEHETYWFGPINVQYYHWITDNWATYCKDTELRGIFHFGNDKDWEEWWRTGNSKCTKEDLEKKRERSNSQLCCFEWWADSVTSKDVYIHIKDLYDEVSDRIKDDKEN